MAVTVDQLINSKEQKLLGQYLYLNSEWLMSTWSSVEDMAKEAIKVDPKLLDGALWTRELVDRKKKDDSKTWKAVGVSIFLKDRSGIIKFDLPSTWADRADWISAAEILIVGMVFAPRGPSAAV